MAAALVLLAGSTWRRSWIAGGRARPSAARSSPCRCRAGCERQYLVRRRHHQARGRPSGVARLDELARRPDQHVGVPNSRHAVLGHGLDRDPCRAHAEVDGRGAAGLWRARRTARPSSPARRGPRGRRGTERNSSSCVRSALDRPERERAEGIGAQRRTQSVGRRLAGWTTPLPGSDVDRRVPSAAQASRSSIA